MKNRVIAYIRVSTVEQGESGLGLEAQRATIAAHAKANGLEVVRWEAEVDSAVSGERPVRFDCLEAIASGEADGIIVAAQSRIARSVIEMAALLEWAERKDARVVLCDTGMDTATPSGKLVASIMAAVSEHEADLISERTRKAMAARKAQGKAISRPTVSDQVSAVIRSLRDEGNSLNEICSILNEREIPTARGGKEWRPSSVQTALGYKRPKKRVRASLPA